MASLTVRNLDPQTKQQLREQAARNGRSMEEEVRLLLAGGVDSAETLPTVDIANKPAFRTVQKNPEAKRILLVITGGIAAYKTLELIRLMKKAGHQVTTVMSSAAREFITELSVGALSHGKVFTDIFDRDDEHDVGHIRLARDCDMIVVAPASADFLAKMANGQANDLASTVLLAARVPILVAPAMNPAMWNNPATQRNLATLQSDGIRFIGPQSGEMAEANEAGTGRMSEPEAIFSEATNMLSGRDEAGSLFGWTFLVTAGPTHEPIDPVRYIANRSSGKQGYAIAGVLAQLGAQVTLVSGPVNLPTPAGVDRIDVESARDMHEAVMALLPVDGAIMVAAVADWRSADYVDRKIKKKHDGKKAMQLALAENPDILHEVGHHQKRPKLVVGFAAETDTVTKNAAAKLKRKGADWIVANDVSVGKDGKGVMGGDHNKVQLLRKIGNETWPQMSKWQVAEKLADEISDYFGDITIQEERINV